MGFRYDMYQKHLDNDMKEIIEDTIDQHNLFINKQSITPANFSECDFTDSDIEDAILCSANLIGKDFTGANCKGVNFANADLSGANFTDANCEDACFENAMVVGAIFKNTNLNSVDGLTKL